MDKFWPGPLTILFNKLPHIPDTVTCGQPTVAVRMPSHPIAKRLIELSGLPIAAPSANLSGRPSPTTANHVFQDLKGRIKCIIDGGGCQVGVESTVIDVIREPPLILRPGGVTLEQLREFLPNIQVFGSNNTLLPKDINLVENPPTPGLKYRHYSPKAQVILFDGSPQKFERPLIETIQKAILNKQKVGLIHTHPKTIPISEEISSSELFILYPLGSEDDPSLIARGLFEALRELDEKEVHIIVMEGIPENNEGLAVMNRIRKASSIIHKFY